MPGACAFQFLLLGGDANRGQRSWCAQVSCMGAFLTISLMLEACVPTVDDGGGPHSTSANLIYVCERRPGVAYRSSRNVNDRWTEVAGPRFGELVTAREVVGDWIGVEVPGHGMKYLPTVDADKELFRPVDASEIASEDSFKFQQGMQLFRTIMQETGTKCTSKALKALQGAARSAPPKHDDLGQMHFLLALCYREHQLADKEMHHYERVIELGDQNFLQKSHLYLALRTFVQQRHASMPDWSRVYAVANAALPFNRGHPEILLWLGLAEIKRGKTQDGLGRVAQARKTGALGEPQLVTAAEVIGGSDLPWSMANDFFLEARKLYPHSVMLLSRHATTCSNYGEDYANQDREIVVPALRAAAKLIVARFRKDAPQKSAGVLNCSGQPKVVYNWADPRVQDVAEVMWPSLLGSAEPYGSQLPLMWFEAAPENFTWGSLVYQERTAFIATLRDVYVVSGAQGGFVFDQGCRIYINNHNERDFGSYGPTDLADKVEGISNWTVLKRAVWLWGSSSVYHVLAEEMCRVLLLRDRWSADPIIQFLMVGDHSVAGLLRKFMMHSFGLSASRFVELTSGGVRVEELHYADWRLLDAKGKPVPDNGELYHYLPPRRVIRSLRSHLAVQNPPEAATRSSKLVNLVWISRHETRRIWREDALLQRVRATWNNRTDGFDPDSVVVLGQNWPSLADTQRIFSQAFAVVGVGGAGLTNIIFSREGTHLVDIACPQRFCHFHGHLAVALDYRYWFIRGPRLLHGLQQFPVREEEVLGVIAEIAQQRFGDTNVCGTNVGDDGFCRAGDGSEMAPADTASDEPA